MMSRLIAVTAILALPTGALADPAYSSNQIESFFNQALTCPEGETCVPKSKTRAICIGTSQSCNNEETAAAADPGGFDMLITFELGSDRLSKQARENLSEFAKALKGNKLGAAEFNIEGHTDASGSDNFNLNLSNRRAASVVSYLESLGVPSSRLNATGFGESKPRVDDPFAAINRRVEATIRFQ